MKSTLLFLLQAFHITVPYALAALGGTLAERSGVIMLGLEGMILTGAFGAAVGANAAGVGAGVVVGIAGGVALALIFLFAVSRGADQIVSGIAVNLLAIGLTRYLLKLVFHSASSTPHLPGFDSSLAENVVVVATVALVLGAQLWITRTAGGLRLTAAGEHPEAARSLGVEPAGVRSRAVLASGVLAGLAGAWLALDNHGFVDQMSGGRGYIALAAMIFGKWSPAGAAVGCLLFGFADAEQIRLQAHASASIPRELIQSIPYVLTIVTLAGVIGRSRAPAALGKW